MSIPSRVVIEIPLLAAIVNHDGQTKPSVIYDELAVCFELTKEDLERLTNDGTEPVWHNTVRQARRTLVEKGEIDNSVHGIWRITEAGNARLRTYQTRFGDNNITIDRLSSRNLPESLDNDSVTLTYIPEEVPASDGYREGARQQIYVNSYERNPTARKKCIEHYGARCYVCNFNFVSKYGDVGMGLIHVHHLRPLYELREEYIIDPIADLRPVCPNCHAIIHQRKPAYSIEEVRAMLHGYSG